MSDENPSKLKENANQWLTKGGGGLIAGLFVMFGNNFMDKQDAILVKLDAMNVTVLKSESERDRMRDSIGLLQEDVRALEHLGNNLTDRVQVHSNQVQSLRAALKRVCDLANKQCDLSFNIPEEYR